MTTERYIAIDNVCAWPILTQMPDGAIVATIFNQPTHGGWEGDVECWASEDQGRTWHLRGVPAPHEPGTNRMNYAAGLGHDGALIVLVAGWSRRNPAGDYSDLHEGDVLPIWVCRSENGGRDWERTESVAPAPGRTDWRLPFGDIVQLRDRTLGVCIYSWSPPDECNDAYFYTSSDDGRTWHIQGSIQEGNTNETTPLVLPNSQLLAVARTWDDQHLELYSSEDGGTTWISSGPVTLKKQHPGHLLHLKDGRLLLSYGIRKGLYGLGTRFSSDEGKTWEPQRVLVDFEIATDGGYPWSVETEDGTIVTAYYCNRVPAHQRYHMGVVRWKPGEV